MDSGQVFSLRPKFVIHDPDGQKGVTQFVPLDPGGVTEFAAQGTPDDGADVIVGRSRIDRIEVIEDSEAVAPDGWNHETGVIPRLDPTRHRVGMYPGGWEDLGYEPAWYFEHVPPAGTALVVSDGYGLYKADRYLTRAGGSTRHRPVDVISWDGDLRSDYQEASTIRYASLVPFVENEGDGDGAAVQPAPSLPRPFQLVRDVDETGVSGTGVVAEGCEFSGGVAVVRWVTEWPTSSVLHDRGMASVKHIHGHGGKTRIVYTDNGEEYEPSEPEPPARVIKDARIMGGISIDPVGAPGTSLGLADRTPLALMTPGLIRALQKLMDSYGPKGVADAVTQIRERMLLHKVDSTVVCDSILGAPVDGE